MLPSFIAMYFSELFPSIWNFFVTSGCTALIWSGRCGQNEACELLVRIKSDVNAKCNEWSSTNQLASLSFSFVLFSINFALYWTLTQQRKHCSLVRCKQRSCASLPNTTSKRKRHRHNGQHVITPFLPGQIAYFPPVWNSLTIVCQFCEFLSRGKTPLMASAFQAYLSTAEVLVQSKADINAKNTWAILYIYKALCLSLFSPLLQYSAGDSALKMAIDNSSNLVVEFLRSNGAAE